MFKKFTYLILSCFAIGSCGEEKEIPVAEASFNVVSTQIDVHEEILFLNKSSNSSSYFWDFGDDSFSSEENPLHAYTQLGEYTVSLTAMDDLGRSSFFERTIQTNYRAFSEFYLVRSNDELPYSLLFFFGEQENPENSYLLRFPDNLKLRDLPFGGRLQFDTLVGFTDTNWFWMLIDNKEPYSQFDSNDILLAGSTINPSKSENSSNSEEKWFDIDKTVNHLGDTSSNFYFRIGYTMIPH